MKYADWFLHGFSLMLLWLHLASARIKFRNNKDVYCGACLGLIDEMQWQIMKVAPEKTVEVGSFRVDPQGNQKLTKVPLARSEVHLTEVLEEVCDVMNQYGESYDRNSRRKTYVKTSSKDGSAVTLSNMQISGDIHSQLKFACETIIEEYEEELVPLLQKETEEDDTPKQFCVETTDLCNTRNVTDFVKKLADAYNELYRKDQEPEGDAGDSVAPAEEQEGRSDEQTQTQSESEPAEPVKAEEDTQQSDETKPDSDSSESKDEL